MQENKQLTEVNGETRKERVQLRSVGGKNDSRSNADAVDGSGYAVSRSDEPEVDQKNRKCIGIFANIYISFIQVHDNGADIMYGFKSPNSSGTMSSSGEEEDVLRQQQMDKLQHELEMTRKEWLAEQQRVSELEEQLIAISE